MIRHIVMWKSKETTTKTDLDNLLNLSKNLKEIPGVLNLEFIVNALSSSTHNIMLNAVFNTLEELAAYQVNPIHVDFGSHLKPLVYDRVCIDYEF